MWIELTQNDGQKIAINFDQVLLILPTSEGTEITHVGGGTSYVVEPFELVVKKIRLATPS